MLKAVFNFDIFYYLFLYYVLIIRYLGYYNGYFDHSRKCDKKHIAEDRIILPFFTKSLERVNLQHVMNKPKHQRLLGNVTTTEKNKIKVEITYKYNQDIGSQLFNYNKLLKNTSYEQLISISKGTCDCSQFGAHIDKDCGHVITANMSIMNNEQFEKTLNYGTNYRIDKVGITKEELGEIMQVINKYAMKTAKRS